jgi:hypothetical protein
LWGKRIVGKTKEQYNRYPFWSPRFLHSMLVGDWLRLLARNRFAVHPVRWPMALILVPFCSINTILRWIERIVYGRRVAATEIRHAPIFILGHWRSGTTYLHEMLMLDERFTTSTTYQVFAANHFLVSQRIFSPILSLFLPKYRPTDNVLFGMKRPQEDEFAQISMGRPTPYLSMAFPNHHPPDQDYLDLQGLTGEQVEEWKAALLGFLRRITFRDPRRIVLKSPPHTARVNVLLEMFPDARFIHIVRDPYVLYPSTMRLWKSLYETQGLQVPRFAGLEEHVLRTFERMYEAFQSQRDSIPPGHLVDVRYEDFVEDPVAQLRRIYDALGLGDARAVLPAWQGCVREQSDYKTNRYRLTPDERDAITRRWSDYIERYNYAPAPPGTE